MLTLGMESLLKNKLDWVPVVLFGLLSWLTFSIRTFSRTFLLGFLDANLLWISWWFFTSFLGFSLGLLANVIYVHIQTKKFLESYGDKITSYPVVSAPGELNWLIGGVFSLLSGLVLAEIYHISSGCESIIEMLILKWHYMDTIPKVALGFLLVIVAIVVLLGALAGTCFLAYAGWIMANTVLKKVLVVCIWFQLIVKSFKMASDAGVPWWAPTLFWVVQIIVSVLVILKR